MSNIIKPNTGLLFMKVGLHAGETFDQILERKKREYDAAGMIFWGYGGGTCHPSRVVQPFGRLSVEENNSDIYIVMEEINSRHPPSKIFAKEYSEDGLIWKPIPRGIEVRGSRYAVVLDEIKDGDLDLDLSQYHIANGPSQGKAASGYIKGRVDKACIERTQAATGIKVVKPDIKKITHFAKIKNPYAVFTR